MAPLTFFDTCVRIGRSRAPDPPGNVAAVGDLLGCMERYHVRGAAVEHAVAREAAPRLGHGLLDEEIAGHDHLRPAWHLMPDISPRIERAAIDPDELLRRRVALGRVDAKDFLQGRGDQACFAPVLEACSAIRLPVCFDFRTQGDVNAFDFDICRRWPRIPFIIEGFGGYPLHRVVWCLREYPNLHLSTVGLSMFRAVTLLAETVGTEKLIFGSGWPIAPMGTSLGQVVFAGLGQADRQLVAAGNFQRLLAAVGGGS